MRENDPLGLIQSDGQFFPPDEPKEKPESLIEHMFIELSKEVRNGKT